MKPHIRLHYVHVVRLNETRPRSAWFAHYVSRRPDRPHCAAGVCHVMGAANQLGRTPLDALVYLRRAEREARARLWAPDYFYRGPPR